MVVPSAWYSVVNRSQPVWAEYQSWFMVYQRSGAGNRHFCNLLAIIEDHINIILNLFFTGNAIQSCHGHLKSSGGRSKNGIICVYTVKNNRNRHENDVIGGPFLCLVSHVCTESAIFAPATGRLDTALTVVYGIFRWKILKYYINMVRYSC